MKSVLCSILICAFLAACNTSRNISETQDSNHVKNADTISISNDELEYEVIIIESGYDSWMARRAKPKSFYTKTFLESRNIQYVTVWNSRVISSNYDSGLYEMQINYLQGIDYGFDVNYALYHYFVFFEEKYKQKLTSHNARF